MATELGQSFADFLRAKELADAEARRAAEAAAVPPIVLPPSYSLNSLVAKPGEPIRVMSTGEVGKLASEQANGGPVQPEVTDTLLKTMPVTRTGGVPKMVLPIAAGWRNVTPQQFAQGQRPTKQQDFVVVPQVAPPAEYWQYNPDSWKEFIDDKRVQEIAKQIHAHEGDQLPFDNKDEYYIKRAIQQIRINAIRNHYGQNNIAFAFHNEGTPGDTRENKVIPDTLPVGIPGVPALQFNAPIAPTIVGTIAAGGQSVYDALIADRMFDFGQAMLGQYDPKKLESMATSAPIETPKVSGFAGGQEERRSRNPFAGAQKELVSSINKIISSKYSTEQLAAMTPEERKKVGYEAAKLHMQNQALQNLKSAFELNKSKNEGIWGYRTSDYYKEGTNLSKLTQQTASSFVPTAAPMLASLFGSMATGGPWGGKAASAAMTYKLSTDSQFLEDVTQWAGDNGIDINQDPSVVIDQMVKMAEKDPAGFNKKLKEMVHHARVTGGLEAGVAFALNEGLEHLKLPAGKEGTLWEGVKEGSIWEAVRKSGNPGVIRGFLIPRAAKMLEDTGREAIEEYLTEVFVDLGKGIDENMQNGDDLRTAVRKRLKEISASYQEDDPNADEATRNARKAMAEQRNDAGKIGAYMSLMTRLLTGKGNPDTALIRDARRNAAQVIAARSTKPTTVEEIEERLKKTEGHTFAQLVDLADEMSTMAGNGRLSDDVQRRISPLTAEQFQEYFPSNGRIGGEDVLSPGQRAVVDPAPIVQTVAPRNADAEMAINLARAVAENKRVAEADAARAAEEAERRRVFEEQSAEYDRKRQLETDRYAAWEALRDANRNYANLLQEYGQNSDNPEFLKARQELMDASARYKALHPEEGK